MKTRLQILLTSLGLFCLFIADAQNAVWTRTENAPAVRPQLTGFSASEKNKIVSLNWSTSQEQNSSHFIIERSADGLQFDSIGAVTALGRFDLPTSYKFIDLQSNGAGKYYRVKIISLDGVDDYGRVLKVELNNERKSVVTK